MLPDNNFARVTHFFDGAAVPTGAAIGYALRKTGGSAFGAADVTPIVTAFSANMLKEMSTTCALTKTILKVGPDEDGPTFEDSTFVDGDQAGGAAAPNLSVLITKSTASGGRRGKGRLYLPGVPEVNVDPGGFLSGAVRDQWQSNTDDWVTDLLDGTVDYFLMLEHFGVGADAPTDIVAMTVQLQCATQRRRLRR